MFIYVFGLKQTRHFFKKNYIKHAKTTSMSGWSLFLPSLLNTQFRLNL